MANDFKRWRGAVEPAEVGASGNEYQRWRGAVEPQGLNIEQAAFRWGNDDGSESAYTFINAQNVDLTQAGTTAAILRYLINTSGDTAAMQLKIQVKRSTGPAGEWRDVPLE